MVIIADRIMACRAPSSRRQPQPPPAHDSPGRVPARPV